MIIYVVEAILSDHGASKYPGINSARKTNKTNVGKLGKGSVRTPLGRLPRSQVLSRDIANGGESPGFGGRLGFLFDMLSILL